jgi:hypothetical protein
MVGLLNVVYIWVFPLSALIAHALSSPPLLMGLQHRDRRIEKRESRETFVRRVKDTLNQVRDEGTQTFD